MDASEVTERFRSAQRPRLSRLMGSRGWRSVLEDANFVEWCRQTRLAASAPPSQLRGVPQYLVRANGAQVEKMVAAGVTDRERLVEALGDWRQALAHDHEHPLLFLGLTVTTRCSFRPRCLYCNQIRADDRIGIARFKELITEAARPDPPYVYITGGEPLLLGEDVWGAEGLAAHAASLGCAVNINTNAALISPRVAMHLVRSGVTRLHISIDSADAETQAALFGRKVRVAQVRRGIRNVLIARELLDSEHPRVHINCVVTNRNYAQVPELLEAVWALAPEQQGQTGLDDFAFHLIPVGGASNAQLRPSAAEWKRFYTEIWDRADHVWQAEQARRGVADADRRPLAEVVPFANSFLRVDHHMSLDDYCQRAAEGIYWQGALCERCWVAPSQACVLPDGSQHWCGGHAIRRPPALGNAATSGLRDNIRASLDGLADLPGPYCTGCAGATCVINQSTRSALYAHVDGLLAARQPSA